MKTSWMSPFAHASRACCFTLGIAMHACPQAPRPLAQVAFLRAASQTQPPALPSRPAAASSGHPAAKPAPAAACGRRRQLPVGGSRRQAAAAGSGGLDPTSVDEAMPPIIRRQQERQQRQQALQAAQEAMPPASTLHAGKAGRPPLRSKSEQAMQPSSALKWDDASVTRLAHLPTCPPPSPRPTLTCSPPGWCLQGTATQHSRPSTTPQSGWSPQRRSGRCCTGATWRRRGACLAASWQR